MNFLLDINFNDNEVDYLEETIPNILKEKMVENKKLITNNLTFLTNLGIDNYKDIFFKFYDMFLMDYSSFSSIFEKYDKEDLKAKLIQNIDIIEYL